MAENSKIEWCDTTWNPIVGCCHKSAGCDSCYAARMAFRLGHGGLMKPGPTRDAYAKVIDPQTRQWNGEIAFIRKNLQTPLRWRKPRRIFVGSMGDLGHPGVKTQDLDRLLEVINDTPQHTYMFLTKRPIQLEKNLYEVSRSNPFRILGDGDYLPNLWFGVTAENQRYADERIPELLKIPAAIHFVSCEPLLSHVDLTPWIDQLDWVIAGGESGPNARAADPNWSFRSLRNQCVWTDTPFFFKQWGGVNKRRTGRLLDGREHNQFPKEERERNERKR